MEILNKNYRKKTVLRLSAMGIFVLALTLTAVFAFHHAYANQGQTEIVKLEKELENARAKSVVEINSLQNQINRMKQQHQEDLANKVSDDQIEKLRDQIDDLKKEKRETEDDLRIYKNELLKCQMQN